MAEEETISTTSDVSTEQTTQDVVTDNQTTEEVTETTQPDETTQEPENVENTETEKVETEQPKDWEKIAKDNQASFTKVSQELAELKKQIADNKPKIVDDTGKITKDYEQKYKFEIDNREFLAYDNLARQLDSEVRDEVEKLLNEAKSLYNPNNTTAYRQKMAEVEDYFRADIVKQIALDRKTLEDKMQQEFDRYINEDKQRRANELADKIETVPDLKELVYNQSENYSEPVFNIVKQLFDLTGGLDVEMTTNAIKSIKELGVKEYLASQSVKQVKSNANVPQGGNVVTTNTTGLPTRAELVENPSMYRKAVEKFGMDKVDEIIMKG